MTEKQITKQMIDYAKARQISKNGYYSKILKWLTPRPKNFIIRKKN